MATFLPECRRAKRPNSANRGCASPSSGDRSRFPRQVQEISRAGRAGDRRRRAADARTGASRQLLVAQRTGARRATARRPGRGRGIAGRSDRRTDRRQRALHGPLSRSHLVIRTSGEMRLSNFLLWQSSYACIISPTCCGPISLAATSRLCRRRFMTRPPFRISPRELETVTRK